MEVIPSVLPAKTQKQGNAEPRVFKDFKSVKAGGGSAVCYHSLRLSEHQYKREGELDFVVLSPLGILFLEVKGGGVTRDEKGRWKHTNRYGETFTKSEGPFKQVSSAMWSVMKGKDLKRLCGNGEYRDIVHGYGVIFPDCDFADIETVEWDRRTVLDARNYKTPRDLDSFVQQLFSYWRGKVGASKNRKIGGQLLYRLKQFFRPKFERVPTLHNRGADAARRMESLTEEQYTYIDAVSNNDRILCSGGAGTGKTFLAGETARRHADNGSSVLLTCRSQTLASHLKEGFRQNDQVDIRAFSELDPNSSQYDVLIMDEGQDLLNFDSLDTIENALKGGLEEGTWRFFYDGNNQSGIYGDFDPEAVSYLRSCGGIAIHLTRNCRNTHNIVLQIKMLTAADLGTPSAGTGLAVNFGFSENRKGRASKLQAWINELLHDDVENGHITILSPESFSDSTASLLPSSLQRQIREVKPENAHQFPFDSISFSTIENFKGLENRFISVVDLRAIEASGTEEGEAEGEENPLSQIYVGMSRAQYGLQMILPEELREDYQRITIERLGQIDDDLSPQ